MDFENDEVAHGVLPNLGHTYIIRLPAAENPPILSLQPWGVSEASELA